MYEKKCDNEYWRDFIVDMEYRFDVCWTEMKTWCQPAAGTQLLASSR